MDSGTKKYYESFLKLSNAVDHFIQEVNHLKLSNMATDEWTVKDVLCHIVFWHNYYAKQHSALASGKNPVIFKSKGGSTRNQEGVDLLKSLSKENLIEKLNKSHKDLYRSIIVNQVPGMDYTDKKHYQTEESLEVIAGHINRHALQVKRSK